ncbi:hypothetical protein EBQ74_05200 [bacterium]|nr:hypothetical protein [bacterium]
MVLKPTFIKALFVFLTFAGVSLSFAETSTSGGGRGGPFIEYHANPLSRFDAGVSGSPVVIGGIGLCVGNS